MNTLDNYQFVTGVHGNELVPILALATKNIPQLIANPSAVFKRVRFVEKDLNASFGSGDKTLEEKRASEILSLLDKERLIIDFHTTVSVQEPFVIIVDKKLIGFAQKLGIKKIVYMKYNNKGGHALINHIDGVSIECGVHDSPEAFNVCFKVLDSLEKGIVQECEIYEVYDQITEEGNYINFVPHKNGFIPIFAMKNSYGNYGLKARLITKRSS